MYYCCNLTRTPKGIPLISSLSLSRSFPNHYSAAAAAAATANHPSETQVSIHQQLKCLPRGNPSGSRFGGGSRLFSTVDNDDAGRRRGRRGSTRQLPWIISSSSSSSSSAAASYKEKEEKRQGGEGGRGRLDKKNVRSNPSSWEDSADRYFSRNSTDFPPQTKESKEDGEESDKMKKKKRRTVTTQRDSLQEGGNYEYRRNSYHALEDRAEEQQVEPAEEDDAEPIHDPRWDNRIKSKYRGFIDRGESRLDKPEFRHWNNKQENWGKNTWKEAKDSSLPKMVGQGVYGVAPVLAALSVERRELYALYVQQGLDLSGNNRKKKNKDKKGVAKVIKLAQNIGLKVIEASKHDLNTVVDNRPHQGLVLDASPLEMVNIKELEPPASVKGHKALIWVALDEVTDPQNLGAIVRSSYFFGVQGVVLCAKNSAPLSGVVSKASAGSLELIEVRSCKNMMQFLSSSIENGWRVLGGSVSTRALSLNNVESGVPTILVLGSEGSGLRPIVERSCTHLVRIPGNMSISECPGEIQETDEMDQTHLGRELKSFLAVESLNVSVAAGVLLYHLGGNNNHLVDTSSDVAYD